MNSRARRDSLGGVIVEGNNAGSASKAIGDDIAHIIVDAAGERHPLPASGPGGAPFQDWPPNYRIEPLGSLIGRGELGSMPRQPFCGADGLSHGVERSGYGHWTTPK
jgi:hypothetical protein